jgi:hypothetical protein
MSRSGCPGLDVQVKFSAPRKQDCHFIFPPGGISGKISGGKDRENGERGAGLDAPFSIVEG